jgi:hypothetical protein
MLCTIVQIANSLYHQVSLIYIQQVSTIIREQRWIVHEGQAVDVSLVEEVVAIVSGEDLHRHVLVSHVALPHRAEPEGNE